MNTLIIKKDEKFNFISCCSNVCVWYEHEGTGWCTRLKKVENEVKQRMTEFITTCLDYNNLEQQENQPDFMTNEYNENFIACIQRAGEENMPWPDFDPWIDAQDFDNVSFTIKSIKAIDKDNAVMTLVVENLGEVMEKL